MNEMIIAYNDDYNKGWWRGLKQGGQAAAKSMGKFIPPTLGAIGGALCGRYCSNSNNLTERVVYGALAGTLIGSAGSLGWYYYNKKAKNRNL